MFVFAGHGSPTPWRPYANGDESARIDKHRARNRARWAPGEIRHVLCLPTGLGRGRHPGSCESRRFLAFNQFLPVPSRQPEG